MLDSAILDVAIGIILLFLVASLAASGIVEGVGGFLHRRSKNLWDTIDLLLDNARDINGAKIVDELYQQPGMKALVRPSHRAFFDPADASTTRTFRVHRKKKGQAKIPWRALARKKGIQTSASGNTQVLRRYYGPDHVDPLDFAGSIVTLARPEGQASAALTDVQSWVDNQLPAGSLKTHLQGHLADATGDLTKLQASIGDWYERHMTSVSRWYRKQTRWFLFIAGLVLAASLNLDGIHAATTLYTDEAVREAVVEKAADLQAAKCQTKPDDEQVTCLQTNIDDSVTLPIGWDNATSPDAVGWLLRVLGWAVVAAAATLGAPFWFDLLRRALKFRDEQAQK